MSNQPREPITFQRYEAIWEAYRSGTRRPAHLSRQFGISPSVIKRLINDGDIAQGWHPLKLRLQTFEHDQQVLRDQQALEAERKNQEELSKGRTLALQLSNAAKQLAGRSLVKFAAAIDNMTFDRERRVKVQAQDGTWVWEWRKIPPSGAEVAEAFAKLAEAVATLVTIDKEAMSGGEHLLAAQAAAKQVVRTGITQEQLEFIAKTGQMPPGVSEADLLALDPSAMAPPRSN